MSDLIAGIAVIGGTGFYRFLEDPQTHDVQTPYGEPSAPVSVGFVAGRGVAFLPRHGPGHALPPHRINYRANLWALRSLGVRQVLAPCAVGGLRTDVAPGDVVAPDQLVDRTSGRTHTFVEQGAVHAPFADPYCPRPAHEGQGHHDDRLASQRCVPPHGRQPERAAVEQQPQRL